MKLRHKPGKTISSKYVGVPCSDRVLWGRRKRIEKEGGGIKLDGVFFFFCFFLFFFCGETLRLECDGSQRVQGGGGGGGGGGGRGGGGEAVGGGGGMGG